MTRLLDATQELAKTREIYEVFDSATLHNVKKKLQRSPKLNTVRLSAIDELLASRNGSELTADSGTEASDLDSAISREDFLAYLPEHKYIFRPTGDLWPAASVNEAIRQINGLKASTFLDRHQSVEQMTWAPGEPNVITGRLVDHGGWIEHDGVSTYNLYRAPTATLGNADEAGPWIRHIEHVYPSAADHIIAWLAHRVQYPGDKPNHALVLGGSQGVGKDTLLEPVKHAVGPWNFHEVSPGHLLGRFNGFVKSVILRISEARDLGDFDRFSFYEHIKVYTAAPPDVLRCDEKHAKEYGVLNVCGVILTTNYKSNGIYLPADDRRHFVAWSDLTAQDFQPSYWREIWDWYEHGGRENVVAYLSRFDLSDFDPKAPPPKTAAFWDIVDANRAPEDAELADVLDRISWPAALTLRDIVDAAYDDVFADWLKDRKNNRQIPHRMESAGYVKVRNDAAKDGLWKVGSRRQAIYAQSDLSVRDRIGAAQELTGDKR